MTEQLATNPPEKDNTETPEQKIEREKQELLGRVSSATLSTMSHRVAWILNNFPTTRNSDITLQVKYWQTFQKDKVFGGYVKLDDLYEMPRLPSLVRARAKIQNEYNLFRPDPAVAAQRGTLEKEERERAIANTDYPVYAVFLDESGKTSPTLIVGSLWFLSLSEELFALQTASMELREKNRFSGEFHFSAMRKDDLRVYKELVDLFVTKGGTISFKFISVEKHGIKNVQAAMNDLYHQLLVRGINHEIKTGRAPLPRILNVWKDSEEAGADKVLMATLETKLNEAAKSIYENKLVVEKCVALDSKSNLFLQVADLVASSVNRILTRSAGPHNHKDEFAEYLVSRLGISVNPDLDIPVGDLVAHIRL